MEDNLTTRIQALRDKARAAAPCPRCDGRGVIAEYVFVNGGKCYDCQGTGVSDKRLIASRNG